MNFIIFLMLVLNSLVAWSKVTTYEVKSVKSLTPFVDRLYNSQNISFANIFCQENKAENAALVLVIDGSPLDGKIFFFPSVAACNESRALVQEKHKNCSVSLVLNSDDQSAQVHVGNCL